MIHEEEVVFELLDEGPKLLSHPKVIESMKKITKSKKYRFLGILQTWFKILGSFVTSKRHMPQELVLHTLDIFSQL